MNGKLFSSVRIAALPAMHVACCRVVSATPEIDVWQRMQEWAEQHGLPRNVRNFGFDVMVTAAQQLAGERGYELWFVLDKPLDPTAPDSTAPEFLDIRMRNFPGGLYASMTIYDPFADPFARIPAGWSRLHHWVAENPQYEAADHQCLEEAVDDEEGQRNLVLYYPVARVAEGVPA